jgi:glycosyltransferase involved in cell wall biosynthesis
MSKPQLAEASHMDMAPANQAAQGSPSGFGVSSYASNPALATRKVFISWAPNCSRSDAIARELGASSHMVYNDRFGSNPLTVVFKYIWQAFATFKILHREKAEVAFAMTPPVFAGATLYLYSLFRPLRYVVDVHTAALLMPRWRRLQWLQAFVCRHAATTLVTNDHLGNLVKAGGGHTTIVRDVPVVYPRSQRFSKPEQFTVAVICSFNYDEPIAEILQAAASLPDVQFFFTGDYRRLAPQVRQLQSSNVSFTGYMSDADYGSLISDAHAVMSLTTRDHTMLRGAYEAIYHGTPVIVSKWPLLQDAFDAGAVHVQAEAGDIAQGIARMRDGIARFKQEAGELRLKKLAAWERTKDAVLERLGKPRQS